ncbi:MAG: 6-phosphogluconolactonase [candidate division NC10 bacterium]|nr:6-phosphogluconolactonase [candidate division NC10 bacterium]MDE2321034.1 6-phosphogluconolactonase [candidate division NC10 bacterium]
MESGWRVGRFDDLLVLADQAALAQEAAERVVATAQEAVTRCGRFTVALAGGSTPKRLYSLLAAEPYCTRLPWHKTYVFWGDERTVPPEHPDSNFGMARATLLSRVPIPSDQIHRMQAERANLDAAARDYETEIARTFIAQSSGEPPVFDLILLGLGTDGHTASLFPYTRALRETIRWVAPNYILELKANRLTLTIPIINRAATVLFLVSGTDKAAMLQAVLEGPPDPERLPAQLIRPVAGRLVWLADQAAASRLGDKAP